MGYWIIVTLIVLGGVLVLFAATSLEPDDDDRDTRESTARAGVLPSNQARQKLEAQAPVPVVLFLPRRWVDHGQAEQAPSIPWAATSIELVDGATLADGADAVEASSINLHDSVVAFIAGPDDFLEGHTLDSVLDRLDQLLERLSELPTMAVVGSIPDLVPAITGVDAGISEASLRGTIDVWNQAISDVARSYSAEFADLASVPVRVIEMDGESPNVAMSVCPDLNELAVVLAPAISRAVDRVRSFRANS